jgi:hypothetical protein
MAIASGRPWAAVFLKVVKELLLRKIVIPRRGRMINRLQRTATSARPVL